MLPRVFAVALALVATSGQLSAQAKRPESPQRFLLSEGSEARYMVTEKLAMNTFDNEVVGKSAAVTGMVVLDASGRVVPADSRIVIDLTTLRTDRARRDSYVQKNTLETARFPKAELRITEIRGLPAQLPATGTASITVLADFALHGVTRPTTWTASVEFTTVGLKGTAKTAVQFADFNITVPRVPVVARVDDPITLELAFAFVRDGGAVVTPENR